MVVPSCRALHRTSTTLRGRLFFHPPSTASKQWRFSSHNAPSVQESVHPISPEVDQLDRYLGHLARSLSHQQGASLTDLYRQYEEEAGTVIKRVVPYEERPSAKRRADVTTADQHVAGDGIVLVVHAQFDEAANRLSKTTVCTGFVVNSGADNHMQGDTIITCAHTLDEMYRHFRRTRTQVEKSMRFFSFIVPSSGKPRIITQLLSSMPRSDVIALEARSLAPAVKLRSLPLSPFPVYSGTPVLTHLFGSNDPPVVQHSIARTKATTKILNSTTIEEPIQWLENNAWRRWGVGQMLGYRSYTGVEIEVRVLKIWGYYLTSS